MDYPGILLYTNFLCSIRVFLTTGLGCRAYWVNSVAGASVQSVYKNQSIKGSGRLLSSSSPSKFVKSHPVPS